MFKAVLKTSWLLPCLMLTTLMVTACSPRDPEVLSPEEKNKSFKKKNYDNNGDKNTGSGASNPNAKIEVPNDVDQRLLQFQIERKNQIIEQISYLEKGLQNKNNFGCVRIQKIKEQNVSADINMLYFQVQFENCTSQVAELSLKTSGAINIQATVAKNTNKWIHAEFKSDDISPLSYAYYNNSLNQNILITEQQYLVLDADVANSAQALKIQVTNFQNKFSGRAILDNNPFNIAVTNTGTGELLLLAQNINAASSGKVEVQGNFQLHLYTRYEAAAEGNASVLQFSQLLENPDNAIKSFTATSTDNIAFCFQDGSDLKLKLDFGKKSKNTTAKSKDQPSDCQRKASIKGFEQVFGFRLFKQESKK